MEAWRLGSGLGSGAGLGRVRGLGSHGAEQQRQAGTALVLDLVVLRLVRDWFRDWFRDIANYDP